MVEPQRTRTFIKGATMRETRQTRSLLILIILTGAAVLGNIFLTVYFWDGKAFDSFSFFVALGLLVVQPCLASIWCALGSERSLVRIPAAMGILIVWLAVYLKTMHVLDNNLPLEVVVVIGCLVISTSIILQIPMWLFRWKTKQVLRLPAVSEPNIGNNQFGIKHLLIAMTLAAVIVAVLRAAFPESELGTTGFFPWWQLSLFLLYFVISTCVLTFLALAVVFSRRRRWVFASLLAVLLLTCPLGGRQTMNNSSLWGVMNWGLMEWLNIYVFIWTIAAGIISVLLVFYLVGYRLEKRPEE